MAGEIIHAGLNVSNSKLQLVEVISTNEAVRLENIGETALSNPIDFNTDSEKNIILKLQSAYDELSLQKSIKSQTLSFSLPLNLFYTAQLPYDNTLLHRDVVEEFKWEFSVLFPFLNIEDLIFQYIDIEKNMVYTKNTSLVYAIERKLIKILHRFCEQNNHRLGYVDNVHLSSERALTLSNSFVKDGLRLSTFIAGDSISAILSMDGKIISQRVFKIKSHDEIHQIIESEISPSKTKKMRKALIHSAYITGEDVSDPMIKDLSEKTGLNFIMFNPFDRLATAEKIAESDLFSKRFSSFSSAAGIAYRMA